MPRWLQEELSPAIRARVNAEQAGTVTVTGPSEETVRVLVDPVLRPPQLYVFGGGSDVYPVSELAEKNGFEVTVVPFRGGRADPDAFPHANRVVSSSAPRLDDSLSIDTDAYAVVMSHNLVDDRLAVESLLDTPVEYIGIMGPQERFDRIREGLDRDKRRLSDADRDRLYAPIGLDLGGGEPYQIATSIVAEVLAVDNGRAAGHLRNRDGPIHDSGDVSE